MFVLFSQKRTLKWDTNYTIKKWSESQREKKIGDKK